MVSDSLEDYTLHILPFISSYTQYIPNISEDFSTFHEFHDRTLPSPSDRRWTLARRRSTRRWVPRREVFSKPRLISTGAEGNHEGSWEAQWKNWKWEKWHTFLKRERHETTPQLSACLIRWYIYNYINTLFYPQYMFSVFLSENRTWTWSPGPRMSMAWWPEMMSYAGPDILDQFMRVWQLRKYKYKYKYLYRDRYIHIYIYTDIDLLQIWYRYRYAYTHTHRFWNCQWPMAGIVWSPFAKNYSCDSFMIHWICIYTYVLCMQ